MRGGEGGGGEGRKGRGKGGRGKGTGGVRVMVREERGVR